MKRIKRLFVVLFFVLPALQYAQSGGLTNTPGGWYFYVDNYYDNGPNTLREAIQVANNSSSYGISGSLVIEIVARNTSYTQCSPGAAARHAYYSNTRILLESDLPTISLTSGINLTIQCISATPEISADPMLNNMINATINSPLTRGLEINTNSNSSSVHLKGLFFKDWNLAMVSYFGNNNSNNGFSIAHILDISDTKSVEIDHCWFRGYGVAVNYKNVGNMKIDYNSFKTWDAPIKQWNTSTNSGYTFPDVFLTNATGAFSGASIAIHNSHSLPQAANRPIEYTEIYYNGIDNLSLKGYGIVFESFEFYNLLNSFYPNYSAGIFNYLNSLIDYDMKTNINIHDNAIASLDYGIIQTMPPPRRTGIDNSYKFRIHHNDIRTLQISVWFGGPNKYFELTDNDFTIQANSTAPLSTLHETIHFGALLDNLVYPMVTSIAFFNMFPDNYFGFEMKQPSSTSQGKNYDNRFHSEPLFPNIKHQIVTEGNFGPTNNNTAGIEFENLFFPGPITVLYGKNTNIRKCLIEPYGTIKPINHDANIMGFTYQTGTPNNVNPSTPYVLPNGGITRPALQEAYLTSSGALKVVFNLNGPVFNSLNAPFVLEFFIAGNNDELLNYVTEVNLPSSSISTGSVYVVSIAPNIVSAFNMANNTRLGVTVTGLGTAASSNYGTSEISYIRISKCPQCLTEFNPLPGKKYQVSGWTKLEGANDAKTYNGHPGFETPVIEVKFYSDLISVPPVQLGSTILFKPDGPIVDGWQKIEGVFEVPLLARGISILATTDRITNGNSLWNASYFDDIRVFPIDASMKSYAYDADNKRLMAELDENNYATFYEYDEEGKLVRVKKETERGIMTIKESRNSKVIR